MEQIRLTRLIGKFAITLRPYTYVCFAKCTTNMYTKVSITVTGLNVKTHWVLFKELVNLISQSLLCLRVSSQQVSCKGESSASGLVAGQHEPN